MVWSIYSVHYGNVNLTAVDEIWRSDSYLCNHHLSYIFFFRQINYTILYLIYLI